MRKYSSLSENELIERLKQDDSEALSTLYYSHVSQLKSFVMKTAKSPFLTEDVVHDTFVKIWENRQNIDSSLPFKPYLYTVARRHLLNLLSRAGQESFILEEIRKYSEVTASTTELTVEYNESNVLLKEAIKKLPMQCREVFVRCRVEGLTYKQAATDLGITESTVNNQMVKALKSIREFIVRKNAFFLILASILRNLL